MRRLVTRTLFGLAVAAPWLWLGAFAALAIAVGAIAGHFPSISNPDPKHVPQAFGLYLATLTLAPAALVSPLILSTTQALRQVMRLPIAPGHWILLNLAGFALILALYFSNAFGLASWYLD